MLIKTLIFIEDIPGSLALAISRRKQRASPYSSCRLAIGSTRAADDSFTLITRVANKWSVAHKGPELIEWRASVITHKMKNADTSCCRTRGETGSPENFINHKYLTRLKSQIFLLRAVEFISRRAVIKCVPVTRWLVYRGPCSVRTRKLINREIRFKTSETVKFKIKSDNKTMRHLAFAREWTTNRAIHIHIYL